LQPDALIHNHTLGYQYAKEHPLALAGIYVNIRIDATSPSRVVNGARKSVIFVLAQKCG